MKKIFTEEQIINILKQHENGLPIKELIRLHNITEQTFYRWKSKYGGMEASDARKLRQVEDENRRLKQLVADLTLDKQALQWVIEKNELSLPVKKK